MPKLRNLSSTFGAQLAVLSAILIAPLILLTVLFVRESRLSIDFVQRELQGVRYLSAVWPGYSAAAAATPAPASTRLAFDAATRELDPGFGTAGASAGFASAPTPAAKVQAGQALIRAVADNSNLVLDPDLDTFYLAAATTVRLPALTRAASELTSLAGRPPLEQAAAVERVAANAAMAEATLGRAAETSPAETRDALTGRISALREAADALAAAARPGAQGGSPAAIAAAGRRLQQEIDLTWRVSGAQLAELLRARRARLLARLYGSLGLVTFFVAASVATAWAIARRLTVRIRGLEGAMTRLTAGDLRVDVPYRDDRGEIGRIAGGVEAFKHASTEKARLMGEVETAYATLEDSQSWLKLALLTGRMGAWRRRFPQDRVDLSPEVAVMVGFPPDMHVTTADIEPLFLDREFIERWSDEARAVAAGELDKLTLDETTVAFRRHDTGEIRWVLLRREIVPDPIHGAPAVVGVGIDITERKYMMDELNHRVKNNLATVLSIAMQSAKSTDDMQGFMKAFTRRIQALSKINEILTRHGWGEVALKDVLTTALRPWLEAGVEFDPASPEHTRVSARAAVSLCLVLNELGANAARGGALAGDGGRVEIAWSEPDPEHGVLTWIERSAHPTPPPTDFGATLIERLVAGDLGGRADLDVRPEGLAATLTFALKGATA